MSMRSGDVAVRIKRMAAVVGVVAFALAVASIASASTQVSGSNGATEHCIAPDTTNLTPTFQAPSWYVPGVTTLCDPADAASPTSAPDEIVPLTATWVFFMACGGTCDAWRTTPDNADYSANDCVASYTTCGTKIIGDASDFYYTCHDGLGLSASQVATNIRYWADRARANGSNWRVYTRTESGGYPYTCLFSVVAL
jgi:hypothetical protein